MATVKEIYDLIKERQRNGEKIGILQQSIIDAYEADEPKTTKEVDVAFQKNENQNTRQPTQDPVEQKEQSE
ncbi:MAG: hypothetical protein HKN86_01730 [Acidimicrobiia bacterium]|nr:hypothetical protein [Acidimicrobiia bacterium]